MSTFRENIWSFLSPLSEITRWSSLGKIGRSPIMKITIIMPFLGYLIIFNPYLIDILNIDFLITAQTDTTQNNFILKITELKLHFLYFGLLFLGLGTLSYQLFSPDIIRSHPSVIDYIKHMETLATDTIVKVTTENLVDQFYVSNNEESLSPFFIIRTLNCPQKLSDSFHKFIEFIYGETLKNNDELRDTPEETEFITGSGYILTDRILEIMSNRISAYRAYSEPLINEAAKNRKDIFFLEHQMHDYSKCGKRFIVYFSYCLGFCLLFLPTVITSLQILKII